MLTMREKELLVMCGELNRMNTHKRLGFMILAMTNPLSREATCKLRNLLYSICDIKYIELYRRTKEELDEPEGFAA